MASLVPFTSSHHPPCPTWLTGCFSRTLCLSVIYDSGFQHYTPSLTNWNPDSSRYIPICEPLSVHLQCNWWAILAGEIISLVCWTSASLVDPCSSVIQCVKLRVWGIGGTTWTSGPLTLEKHIYFCWRWLCGDVECCHWPWCPFAYVKWGIQTKCAKAYPASGFCYCWATRCFCAN